MYSSKVQRLDYGQVHFGFEHDEQADGHLQQAAAKVDDHEASLRFLNEARRNAPEQLDVLQALYKFHFYRGDLQEAQDIVYQSLIKASRQGGFSHDWATLQPDSTDWSVLRGPARSFLYSLKALAFIRLRQHDAQQARHILETLQRLDPADRVGADVIHDLLKGLDDE